MVQVILQIAIFSLISHAPRINDLVHEIQIQLVLFKVLADLQRAELLSTSHYVHLCSCYLQYREIEAAVPFRMAPSSSVVLFKMSG